jgi:hypothetical protein
MPHYARCRRRFRVSALAAMVSSTGEKHQAELAVLEADLQDLFHP